MYRDRIVIDNKKLTKLLKQKTAQKVIEMFMSGFIQLDERQIKYLLDLREEQKEYEKRENEKIDK